MKGIFIGIAEVLNVCLRGKKGKRERIYAFIATNCFTPHMPTMARVEPGPQLRAGIAS